MPSPDLRLPLVVLLGPTAVGKTDFAIVLAERLNGEIVSADSRLFYRGMDIGTAKPTLEERKKIPHHLIDVADPDEIWSLALFQPAARQAVESIHARGKVSFLVGGTGQYIRAVAEEWEVPPQAPDSRLRTALEGWGRSIGPERLHEKLIAIDPEAAQRIEPRNLRRTVRALEVIFLTGKLFSAQRQKSESPYAVLQVGLRRPRPDLYARIDHRIETMLKTGLVDEVRALLERGYSPGLPTMSAIGYGEIINYLYGRSTYEEAVSLIKRATRQFVRRQANWFKDTDPSIIWFDAESNPIIDMENLIRSWLEKHPGESHK